MAELLTTYSLSEIIVFIILLAGAFKGISSFIDWYKDKRRKSTLNEMRPEELDKKIAAEAEIRNSKIKALEEKHAKDLDHLTEQIGGVATQVSNLTTKVDLLVESDKDDIKAFITREYHYFCSKGWIDDYSLDCIEKRYQHYIEEKGNSFVEHLITELRKLPKKPPKDE